jgi:hypothetical protein
MEFKFNMGSYGLKWIEDMPTPWDMDCRGKFCLHKYDFDEYDLRYKHIDGKYKLFTDVREQLNENGKLEFLESNGINFMESTKFTVVRNPHLAKITLAVLVDLPRELRTLYALRFTE